MAAESQHQASESVDWSVWQCCVLLALKCLVRLQHENCYQRDIHHGMNYKGASHYCCQHKNKSEEKSMHDRESMNDQYVLSETFYAGQRKKKALKSVEQLEKSLQFKKKTITQGAADAKTVSGFRY